MSRLVTMRSLSLFLGLAGLATAQEPPPLEPPSLEPPRADAKQAARPESRPNPAGPKPIIPAPPAIVRPKPENRPMLAIPGVTAPASRHPAGYRPPVGGPISQGNTVSAPTLDALPLPSDFPPPRPSLGPSGLPLTDLPSTPPLDALPPRLENAAPARSPNGSRLSRPGPATAPPIGESIPLTIEPFDEEPATARGATGRSSSARTMDGRASDVGASRSTRPDDDPITPRPAPRRAPGLFGRLFGPPPAPLPPPREESRTAEKPRPRRDSDPDSAPDPDILARRKIEKQIAATLGDRVRSVEVSVTGRNVEIRAQPTRFWLRRSVRRSLETLPAIQGYRARIEVTE